MASVPTICSATVQDLQDLEFMELMDRQYIKRRWDGSSRVGRPEMLPQGISGDARRWCSNDDVGRLKESGSDLPASTAIPR